jgi:hypothetical protein
MKQPCKDCPFQKSVKYSLSPEKADEILQAITHDGSFHCQARGRGFCSTQFPKPTTAFVSIAKPVTESSK